MECGRDANQLGMIHFHCRPFIPEVQVLIFMTFLIMYLISISSDDSISLIIWVNVLSTPMYFFLANLATLEVCCSFTFAPLTDSILSTERTLISLPGCGAQMFIFLGITDCILAIRHPLCYTLVMSWHCVQLALGSLLLGFILAMQLTEHIFQLPFCSSKDISLFYCDVPVMRLVEVVANPGHIRFREEVGVW
ncbi:LOW QUALITY PROTEIN: olfactory receptor 10V1 [Molossus nigricans]